MRPEMAATDNAHRYSAYLRLYVALTPDHAESAWQNAHRYDCLPEAQKQPGHWYRYPGSSGLIEFAADGSGEFHKDGKLPPDVDPATVIDIPACEPIPSLLEEMAAILGRVPKEAPNHAAAAETIAVLTDLPTADRAGRLVKSFQATLATVPPTVEDQLRFLGQASRQMVGTELLAGRACGYDVAGVLIIAAIAQAVAAADAPTCLKMLAKSAALEAGSTAELGSRFIQDCFLRGMPAQVTAGLDSLRSQGDAIIRETQKGGYPEGHPELALDMYYGGLLQAVPYLLAAEEGYHLLLQAPGLSGDDKDAYGHKAETAEEKLVRINEALLYAAQDVDLSQLARKQAQVRAIARTDPDKAARLVYEILQLKFLYPLNFDSVLLGDATTAAIPAS